MAQCTHISSFDVYLHNTGELGGTSTNTVYHAIASNVYTGVTGETCINTFIGFCVKVIHTKFLKNIRIKVTMINEIKQNTQKQ